jgi:NADH dehydrogenase (ubiquinone) 1 beta subcomplex subunit 3
MANLPLFRDPWAKRDAWRQHSLFQKRIMFRNAFPGFGIAVVAFSAYVLADNFIFSSEHNQHNKHH